MIGFEAALQLRSFIVLFLFYINGPEEKRMHSILLMSGPLSNLAQNTHQCVVVNIFFQSSSSYGRLSGEIYLAAFSTGLVWHRCSKADFSLCASPQAFLILMGWVSGDISGLWLWQSCGESVVWG